MNMSDLRRFVREHRNVPGDVPVMVCMPSQFACDLPHLRPNDHDVSVIEHIEVNAVVLDGVSFNTDGSISDSERYIPIHRRKADEEWAFRVEIYLNDSQIHDLMTDHRHPS